MGVERCLMSQVLEMTMHILNKTGLGFVLAGVLALTVPAVWAEAAYERDLLI